MALGLALGLVAVAAAAGLFELSRSLYDRARGRWYAGNGRDLFHAGAVGSVTFALVLHGLPVALAAVTAATAAVVPLMVLDWIATRRRRVLTFLAAIGVCVSPALLAPRVVVDAGNATARMLFPALGPGR